MSHRSRLKGPSAQITNESPLIKPITGRAGSVMMWHGGLFHMARANTSDQIRVGLNIAYYPRWFNNWIEGGHQPLWPETYEATKGSLLYEHNRPEADERVVAAVRMAGAIVLGKTNTPEFGAGGNTKNRVYGATGNPFDPVLTCGGSSGGTAAALAAGMVPLATGSD